MTPPELPEQIDYIWLLYIEIRKGCIVITYQDIDAFNRVSGRTLTPWEADIMLMIDKIRASEE